MFREFFRKGENMFQFLSGKRFYLLIAGLWLFSNIALGQGIPGLNISPPPIPPGQPSIYGLVPRPTDDSKLEPSGITIMDVPPAAWDWRANNGVTPVKNQNPYGACWAHAAIGEIESMVRLYQGLTYDFSEFNVIGCNPWGTNCDSGGNDFYAATFLTRNGTVMETCDPYTQCSGSVVCNSCTKMKTPLVWKKLANNVAEIKDMVYHTGPAYTAIYSNATFQTLPAGSVYDYAGGDAANHAVLIVGWDDSKAHPLDGGFGAWLIKNSWGTGWSDAGYGWVAYSTAQIGTAASIYTTYRNFYPDEKVYYYDDKGQNGSVGWNATDWGLVKLTPTANGTLDRVDIWTVGINASYRIRVYDNFDGSNLTGLLASQDGSCDKAGYYSVKLSSPPNVTAADDIFIAVEFTVPGSSTPIPLDMLGTPETGKCWLSDTGVSWTPYNTYDVTIRGRVVPRPVDTDGDGILDYIENSWCTGPTDPDSDDDGLCDGNTSVWSGPTKLCDKGEDLDVDGVVDAGETDPCNPDSDYDQMPDGWEKSYGLDPLNLADAVPDNDTDNRRNLDEYYRGYNPNFAEPGCGEGAYCFADSDGNGIIEVPDLVGLNSVLGGIPANWTQVIPTNGDQMDLDGNGIIEVPDLILINSLIGGSMSGDLPGQADSVNLESSQNVTISVGQWTKITVNLTSSPSAGSQKRSGYGVIFYASSSSGGGAGEFWGGDKASALHPPGRYCTTGTIVADNGRAWMWFKATSAGTVNIQAEAPAHSMKHTKLVQLATPVAVTINGTADTWLATTTSSPPAGRYYHTALWTGSEMIVWGGRDAGYLQTGSRYNPATDSWTATLVGANTPSARIDHVAVWTGSAMVVWGGYNGGYLNTGSRYYPATNTWSVTSTGAGVPAARRYHSGVFNGTEMIVWGGFNGSYLNDGAKYNPAADTWAAISGASAPAIRQWHTAVYTGTDMIVWGGYNGASRLNTGGKYNNSLNSWTATSTTNAPSIRSDHAAVWTGTQMIVWGGQDGSFLTNTGGKYNPAADTWTATTTMGDCLTARYYHSAVWTGSSMIIFGGWSGGYKNDGAKYSPTGNYWTAITTTNAPSIRRWHSAVWTGSSMLIWGGWDGSVYLSTGGRYFP